jgi:hypothetical protein
MTAVEAVARETLDGLLPRIVACAQDAWRTGDRFYLIRQSAYFLERFNECACGQHSCGGCVALLTVLNEIDNRIAKIEVPQDVYDQQRDRARNAWRGIRDYEARRAARIAERKAQGALKPEERERYP